MLIEDAAPEVCPARDLDDAPGPEQLLVPGIGVSLKVPREPRQLALWVPELHVPQLDELRAERLDQQIAASARAASRSASSASKTAIRWSRSGVERPVSDTIDL